MSDLGDLLGVVSDLAIIVDTLSIFKIVGVMPNFAVKLYTIIASHNPNAVGMSAVVGGNNFAHELAQTVAAISHCTGVAPFVNSMCFLSADLLGPQDQSTHDPTQSQTLSSTSPKPEV